MTGRSDSCWTPGISGNLYRRKSEGTGRERAENNIVSVDSTAYENPGENHLRMCLFPSVAAAATGLCSCRAARLRAGRRAGEEEPLLINNNINLPHSTALWSQTSSTPTPKSPRFPRRPWVARETRRKSDASGHGAGGSARDSHRQGQQIQQLIAFNGTGVWWSAWTLLGEIRLQTVYKKKRGGGCNFRGN